MCRKAGLVLNSATGLTEADPAWLWKLRIKGKVALDEKEVERAFLASAKSDSDSYFAKAYAAIQKPLAKGDIENEVSRCEWKLLEFWLAKENAPFFMSFCFYNDKALAKLLDFLLRQNQGHYSEKSIRKTWERLGLKKSTVLLFRDVEIAPLGESAAVMPVLYKVIQSPR